MTINISSMIIALSRKIQTAASSDDILTLSKAVELLQSGAVFTVPTVANLPVGDSARSAQLVLVVADQQLYVYRQSDNQWIPIVNTATTTALSWGCNNIGQIGDGTTTNFTASPVSVIGGFTDWCIIDTGGYHSVAIRADGTAWAWGSNSNGRLGHNTATTCSRSSPVTVAGGFTNWCAISAGYQHSAAIRADGTMWSWGCNTCGQLGDGTVIERSSPVAVTGGFVNWCAIAAGGAGNVAHNLAIRTNGTMWSWGRNFSGQLGDGTVIERSSPVSVTGGISDWCAISANRSHSAAIRTNGTAWSWGYNGSGRLGDGTETDRSSPVAVVGSITDWCAIAAGGRHSAAIRTNGTAWSWGGNSFYGNLGDGTTTNRSSPVSVVGGFTDWCAIAAGSCHSLAIRTNGTAWAWGLNNRGQLGDGSLTTRSSPVFVVGGIADWSAIAGGQYHSVALRTGSL